MLGSDTWPEVTSPWLHLSPGINSRGRKGREAGWAEGGAKLAPVSATWGAPCRLSPVKARPGVWVAFPASECRLPRERARPWSRRQASRGSSKEGGQLSSPASTPKAGGRSPSFHRNTELGGSARYPLQYPTLTQMHKPGEMRPQLLPTSPFEKEGCVHIHIFKDKDKEKGNRYKKLPALDMLLIFPR